MKTDPLPPSINPFPSGEASAQSILEEIRALAREGERGPLDMGDAFVELQRLTGLNNADFRQLLRQVAQEAGVDWEAARQRYWVASRLPPGHPVRAYKLPFTHLRALARVRDPELWAARAVEGARPWTVRQLQQALRNSHRDAAPANSGERDRVTGHLPPDRSLATEELRGRTTAGPTCIPAGSACAHCGTSLQDSEIQATVKTAWGLALHHCGPACVVHTLKRWAGMEGE